MWLDLFLVQISLIPLTVIEIYSSINPMHGLLLFFGGWHGLFYCMVWERNGSGCYNFGLGSRGRKQLSAVKYRGAEFGGFWWLCLALSLLWTTQWWRLNWSSIELSFTKRTRCWTISTAVDSHSTIQWILEWLWWFNWICIIYNGAVECITISSN